MSRTFKTIDYQATLDVSVRLGDLLPPDHLARFIVDTISQLDLSAIYDRYGSRGGEPYAPETLLGLLFYGYATGIFSSRKIERATMSRRPSASSLATCIRTTTRWRTSARAFCRN